MGGLEFGILDGWCSPEKKKGLVKGSGVINVF